MSEDRKKIIAKLIKIKALAERGVGGEQATAQLMYDTLKKRYGITDEEAWQEQKYWCRQKSSAGILPLSFHTAQGLTARALFTGQHRILRQKKYSCCTATLAQSTA